MKKHLKKSIALLTISMSVIALTPISANADWKQNSSQSSASNSISTTTNITQNVIGNTVGNLVNVGIAASKDDWIYYTQKAEHDMDYVLWKSKADGSQKTLINIPHFSSYGNVNIVGDWVYFAEDKKDMCHASICKAKLDGSQKTELLPNLRDFKSLYVIGDNIYYNTWGNKSNNVIGKLKTDGTGQAVILDNGLHEMRDLNVFGDWIYYVEVANTSAEKNAVYKIKTDGIQKTKILESSNLSSRINVVGDWIYGIEGSKEIYKMKTDGSEKTKILDTSTGFMALNVSVDSIYFTELGPNEYGLYRAKIDGSEKTKISDKPSVRNPNVVGDWIYYLHFDQDEDCERTYKVKKDGTGNGLA